MLHIRTITANNFKSLGRFRLELAKFNCLIGLNGSGKSDVLRFITFLSQLVQKVSHTQEPSWRLRALLPRDVLTFSVALRDDAGQEFLWEARFNATAGYCTTERIEAPDALLEVKDATYRVAKAGEGVPFEPIIFQYTGSILSQLHDEFLPLALLQLKRYFGQIRLGSVGPPLGLVDEVAHRVDVMRLESCADELVSAEQQVLVTTHSPSFLNYLEDDIAEAGVIYLYKTPAGHTRAVPFFSIPSMKEKLRVMGPGEVFADTDLVALNEELVAATN